MALINGNKPSTQLNRNIQKNKMSQLKVNALVSYSGNTVTLGTSGDTINVASGVTFNTASATVTLPSTINATTINVTTLVLAAGAVGTPSLTTSGDTNTGIFFPTADTIAFTEGGAEAMRIDSSGNVLIGTTATTGSTSNNIMAVSGIFKTISGSASAPSGTATTLFTAPTLANGTYIVSAGINNTGEPAVYSAVSLISVDNTVIQATALKTATNLSISISGQNVRGTQTSGITTNIVFTATRIH
jgi:hypothetical protein